MAIPGPGGSPSGGTAVLAKTHIPIGELTWPADSNGNPCPPPGFDTGRSSVAFVRGGPTRGMIVVSTYLYTGEGTGERNTRMLSDMAVWLRALGRPYVWGGDFQMSPDDLANTGVTNILGARIHTAGTETHIGTGREIDMFIVSPELSPLVKSVTARRTTLATHTVVRLTMGRYPFQGQHHLVRPPKIDINLPEELGPTKNPEVDWPGIKASIKKVRDRIDDPERPEGPIDHATRCQVAHCTELFYRGGSARSPDS